MWRAGVGCRNLAGGDDIVGVAAGGIEVGVGVVGNWVGVVAAVLVAALAGVGGELGSRAAVLATAVGEVGVGMRLGRRRGRERMGPGSSIVGCSWVVVSRWETQGLVKGLRLCMALGMDWSPLLLCWYVRPRVRLRNQGCV